MEEQFDIMWLLLEEPALIRLPFTSQYLEHLFTLRKYLLNCKVYQHKLHTKTPVCFYDHPSSSENEHP